VPYKHFGARLARLGRFDSCTLHHILCAGSSTDQNSWPTPGERMVSAGSREPTRGRSSGSWLRSPYMTAAGSTPERRTKGRISSKVEPAIDNREVLVRFQHPAPNFMRACG
jgi:hypothetical protein